MKAQQALLLFIMFAAVVAAGYYGCRGDDETERILREYEEQMDRLGRRADSLRIERRSLEDSLEVYRYRLRYADSTRAQAERRTSWALARLENLPTYEDLTDDALALRADSLFRDGARTPR